MPHLPRRLAALVAFLPLAFAGRAPLAAQMPAVPEPLRPWVPWVLEKHPDLGCPLLDGSRLCAWPGRLALDLDERGGTFTLEVGVDREMDLPLPGSAAHWPLDVTSDGAATLMRRLAGGPAARLAAGRHRLAGRFRWSRLPESLPVPRAIAMVDLTVRGAAVRLPRREDDGLLWLAASRREEGEAERVGLEVERLFRDGVPVTLVTRLRLRVSGGSRAVELDAPLPDSFALTGLSGELPVRWAGGERLWVQARPGTWVVTLEARSKGPVTELAVASRPEEDDVWPAQELWAFRADPAVRTVRGSGAPAIDPQRTSLPEEWKSLPVYQVTPGSVLRFEELRRGQPEPPPDALQVRRVWWLEQAGDRFTVRDRLTGEIFEGGRVAALEPAELGRFGLGAGGRDQVITSSPGDGEATLLGVEVRDASVEATAELTYRRRGALPAVGWNRDARSLGGELRVPPGWTLVAAPGVDRASGSWVEQWTLLDLFLLLILTLATWRLDGRLWGVLAFAVLGLGWHEPRFTALWIWWLALLPLRALLGVLPEGYARVARALRWAVLVGFTVQLLVFCADQWRTGLFPQLERKPYGYGSFAELAREGVDVLEEAVLAPSAPRASEGEIPKPKRRPGPSSRVRAQQIDVNAVVQTGPGVPAWQWKSYDLTWNGPVTADHEMRLWLISPGVEWLLSMLRIAGIVLLGWCLIHPRRTPGAAAPEADETPPPGSAAASAAIVLLVLSALLALSAGAQEGDETPTPGILAELEERLTKPPDCHPACVEVPRLAIEANAGGLDLTADVHAAARSAWRLPGPADAWTPARVTVDGRRAAALRLGGDGFFLLRLEPGVHRVELSGPARDSLALELPLPPRALEWKGDGWTIDGWRPDEPPPGAVRLERQLRPDAATADDGDAAFEPEPWLELHRELDIGIPWLIHNELRRRGPPGAVVLARVPLLPGESPTTAGVTVDGGEALVGLEPDETVRRFESTLEETAELTLTAPADRPWLERWELVCSPIWNCAASGLAPTHHMQGGTWRPLWQPWPGEQVTLAFVRPAGAPGRTTTFDRADLRVKPGRRLLEATLELAVRASRGGEQTIALPGAAVLQSFSIDGRQHPVQAEEGRLAFTLDPGAHQLAATWRQDHRAGFFERVPAIGLGGEAVNVTVHVEVPPNRWLLWTGGPGWGPVVQLWQYLLVLVLAAWTLGRWAPAPLKVHDWLLLGAGLTQVPLAAAVFVVGWLLLLALRHRLTTSRWWTYDFLQLALLGLGFVALVVLYAAIHSGLLFQPEMQVLAPGGAAASTSDLQWYVDRSGDTLPGGTLPGGTLPRPWILSLPMWVWRVLMLAWSLWLASRVLRWAPWCWQRLTRGPLLVSPRSFAKWRQGGESA